MTKQKFEFVDLGLPSGNLWATENASGRYNFDEAIKEFGEMLPSEHELQELIIYCKWRVNHKSCDKARITVTGPSGKSITFGPDFGSHWLYGITRTSRNNSNIATKSRVAYIVNDKIACTVFDEVAAYRNYIRPIMTRAI